MQAELETLAMEKPASTDIGKILRYARIIANAQDRTMSAVLTRAGGTSGLYTRIAEGGDMETRSAERILGCLREELGRIRDSVR